MDQRGARNSLTKCFGKRGTVKVLAALDAYVAEGGDPTSPSSPVDQWLALHDIDALKRRYDAGEAFALLHAIKLCAAHELVMPDWLARAYLDKLRTVTHYEVRPLDQAFGSYLPKGSKLSAHRSRIVKGPRVWLEVTRRNAGGEPIDEQLFANIGNEFGHSASIVRDYYYFWKSRLGFGFQPVTVYKNFIRSISRSSWPPPAPAAPAPAPSPGSGGSTGGRNGSTRKSNA
jgi:hypothetical protein